MRRSFLFVAAWLGAGVAAVALATAGVSMVGNQVTGSRPSPLSADEVRQELEARDLSTTTSTTGPTEPSTTTSLGAPSGGEATTEATPRSGTATTRPGTSPTTAPPAPTTTTAEPVELRTYSLVGGTATLRFAPSGVSLVDAVPAAGFSTEIEPTHSNGIRVEFENESHRSRVEGWWDGGPRDATEESSS